MLVIQHTRGAAKYTRVLKVAGERKGGEGASVPSCIAPLIHIKMNGIAAKGLDFSSVLYPHVHKNPRQKFKAEISCPHLLAATLLPLWRFDSTSA